VGASVACTALTTVLVATLPDWHGNSVGRQCSVSVASALLTAVPLLLIANGVVWMVIAARAGVVLAAMASALIAGAAVITATSAADRCTNVSIPPLQIVAPTPEVHSLGPGPTASTCGGPASTRRIAAGSWSSCDELRFGFAIDSFGNELDDLVMNIQVCYPLIQGEGITIYPRGSEIEPCLTAASAGLDTAYAKSAPALARYLPKRAGPCRDAIELYTRDVVESNADAVLARRKVADGDVRGSYAAATRLVNRYVTFQLDRVNIQSACIKQ
jgi:hypothetical protein